MATTAALPKPSDPPPHPVLERLRATLARVYGDRRKHPACRFRLAYDGGMPDIGLGRLAADESLANPVRSGRKQP